MILHDAILVAELGDVISALAALLVPIILVLRYLFSNEEQAGPQQRPQQRRPQQVRRPAQVPPGAPDPADEVEAFLRRAAERRAGGSARDVEILNPQQAPPRSRSAAPARNATSKAPPIETPVPIEAVEVEPIRESVAEHMRRKSAERTAAHAARRETTRQSDAQLHRVGKAFENLGALPELGSQDDPLSGQIADIPTAAAGLAAMLASTESLRTAILVQEILRRPEERW